jgi:membrane protein YqaA with SNARE-associated domain
VDVSILVFAGLICFAGGLLPWINSEAAVVGAALLLPVEAAPALVLGCTVGQMAAKCALYGVSRWAPERLPARAMRLIDRVDRYRERRTLLGLAVLSSALVALPPFYLVTLACGVLRVPLSLFTLAGITGTATRYALLAWMAAGLGP